ncbi:MAG: hypothetical protein RMJ05_08000 [Thermomicrobium sp.]|nr:hypothetical protein [Thermomicrobium sp.]MDW8006650.1 hypothetical protein [Thermomicrobium sp.]
MTLLDDVLGAVRDELATADVGVVHVALPYASTLARIVDSFSQGGIVRAWVLAPRGIRWEASGYGREWVGSLFVGIDGLRAFDASGSSEALFRADLETVLERLRVLAFPTERVVVPKRIEVVRYDSAREIGNLLMHYVEIEYEVEVA